MGAPMTANLARSGYSVTAWNRTPNRPGVRAAKEAGATIVASIREAVARADIVFSCVGDVPDVEEVIFGLDGVAASARPGTLIIDTSTIGAIAARKIGAELKKQNLRFLDAPVSGGDIGAKNGTLTIMVGGEVADFEESKPLLEVMGKTIRLCGGVGSGQAVKLCNQVLASLHMVALCEAMELAKQQEIDRNLIIEVCGTGAAGSWALSHLGPKIVAGDFQPGFAIKHILKDLRLVQDTLESGEELPGVKLAENLFKMVKELDGGTGGELGTQAMIRAYFEA
ncbi:MAG TPA: oxidoreductase [Cyanobacteria bacterium UBA11149]|nr:oxidoreductase [Cyanobacteria bacterium UBA11367]HBE56686.1 oxidoreductase [Cyanobacteria bacterium UBA11366]HBK65115.1 oxidoreductase [Cyanobacteria bacterium UBA11166]HBR73708.1 oxidoreductase [Cyanobacteria bacterium UBA11159]HBS67679.1 oxidoreductase [Cyanobacteria bacterium UBA11153]HBW88833.1 oxidoreductase [Cyanobacteria bacterium UBA11149]HCA97782.1 oxidoreductase [Cyanobacteria bacterium UBA9226]